MQHRDQVDWGQFTYARVRVMAGLADGRSEREVAVLVGVEYTTVRGHVDALKDLTGERDVRSLGRWWRSHRREWVRWCGRQAGMDDEETRNVG